MRGERIPTQYAGYRLWRYANPILARRARNWVRDEVPQPKKEKNDPRVMVVFSFAAELGFEPRHTESESAVLPLHNSALL